MSLENVSNLIVFSGGGAGEPPRPTAISAPFMPEPEPQPERRRVMVKDTLRRIPRIKEGVLEKVMEEASSVDSKVLRKLVLEQSYPEPYSLWHDLELQERFDRSIVIFPLNEQ